MNYVAIKACTLGGQNFRIGDVIPEEKLQPGAVANLVYAGVIAPVDGDIPSEGTKVEYYGTLQDILNATTNGTITLQNDIAEPLVIESGHNITIDLNGHNIVADGTDGLVNRGVLTIKGDGVIKSTQPGYAAVANYPDAVVNIEGGTFDSAKWYTLKNMGEMVIEGGNFSVDGENQTASLIDNGWVSASDRDVPAQEGKAKLTINGGTFIGGAKTCAIVKNDDYGVMEINGGTFDLTANENVDNNSVIINWNELTINDGAFLGRRVISIGCYGADSADKGVMVVNGGSFHGTAELNGWAKGGKETGSLTINGGEFVGPITAQNYEDGTPVYTIDIAGGKFDADVSEFVVEGKTVTNDGEFFVVA